MKYIAISVLCVILAIAALIFVFSGSSGDLSYTTVLGKPGAHSTKSRLPELPLDIVYDQPMGRIVSHQDNGDVIAWDIASGKATNLTRTRSVFAYCPVQQLVIEHDGKDLVLLDLKTQERKPIDTNAYHDAVWNADCTRFAAASEDENELRLWYVDNLTKYDLLHMPMPVRNSMALSRDGKILATAQGTYSDAAGHKTLLEILTEVDPSTYSRLTPKTPADMLLGMWQMALTPDSKNLIVGTQQNAKSGLRSFRIDNGITNWRHDDFQSYWVRAIAVSPDGRLVASGDEKGWLRIWDAESGDKLAEHQTGLVIQTAAFSQDSRQLAIALWDSTIAIIDVSQIED